MRKKSKAKAQLFINSAQKLLPLFNDENYYRFGAYSLVEILGRLGTTEANTLLQQYLNVKDKYLAFEAFKLMLKNGLPVAQKTFENFAADTALRASLYDNLEKTNKLNLFPKNTTRRR